MGRPEDLAVLSTEMMAIFMMSGLLFREALLCGVLLVISALVAAWVLRMPEGTATRSLMFLVFDSVIAAGGGWAMERSTRRTFLLDKLIQEVADRDDLTGLKNRRAFNRRLKRGWAQAIQDQSQIALLMVDVDYFKKVNDRFGHAAGDSLLRQVADRLRISATHAADVAARYGGDEFVVILSNPEEVRVRETAEKIRRAVADLRMTDSNGSVPMSVTIGAALVTPTALRSVDGLLQFADTALYEAKNAGRNCVRMLGPAEYDGTTTEVFGAS